MIKKKRNARAKRKRQKARDAPKRTLLERARAEARAMLQRRTSYPAISLIPFLGDASNALRMLAADVAVPAGLELLFDQLRDAVAQAGVHGLPSLKREGDGNMPIRAQVAAADRRRALGAANAFEFEIGPILARYSDAALLDIAVNEIGGWHEIGAISSIAAWYRSATTPATTGQPIGVAVSATEVRLGPVTVTVADGGGVSVDLQAGRSPGSLCYVNPATGAITATTIARRVDLAPARIALYDLLDAVRAAAARIADPDHVLEVLEHDIAGQLQAIDDAGGLQQAVARYATALVKAYVASIGSVREISSVMLIGQQVVTAGSVTRLNGHVRAPFRIRRLMISTESPSADWEIHGLYCDGGPNQLVNAVPGELFSARAHDAFLEFAVPIARQRIELDVVYVGPNPDGMPFRAALLGTEFVQS